MHMLWNFLAFQVGWFACVLGGANGLPWLGAVTVLILVILHSYIAVRPLDELKLIGAAAMVGFTWDSLLVSAGWLEYPSGLLLAGTAPYWMVAMWANFATTLNVSMRWLKGRWALAAAFGAVGGPLAYYAGAKLGGVVFVEPLAALTALAVGWSVLMPVLTFLATRLNGYEPDLLAPGFVSGRV